MAKAKGTDPLADLINVSSNVPNTPMQGVPALPAEVQAAPAAAAVADVQRLIPAVAQDVGLQVTQTGNMTAPGTQQPQAALTPPRESPQAPMPLQGATAALPTQPTAPVPPPPQYQQQVPSQQVQPVAQDEHHDGDDDDFFDPTSMEDFDPSEFEGPTPIAGPAPALNGVTLPPAPPAAVAPAAPSAATDPNAPPFTVDTPAPVPPPPPGTAAPAVPAAEGTTKKKRRTKAEIEADKQAAAANAAIAAGAAQAQAGGPPPMVPPAPPTTQVPPPPPAPPGMPPVPQQMPQIPMQQQPVVQIPQQPPMVNMTGNMQVTGNGNFAAVPQPAPVMDGGYQPQVVQQNQQVPMTGSINPFQLPPGPGSGAPESNDPDTQFSRALTAYCDQMVRQIFVELGIALLWDQNARQQGNTIHDAIYTMRWQSYTMDQMTPAQLNQIARALSAHQVACTGVENYWEARYQGLAKERDAMLFRKRENYQGATKQDKENACISQDPQMRELHSAFVVAQFIALATRNVGERFVQLENGIKRTIDNNALEMRTHQR